MAQLVNKSLVIADQQAGQTRYRLLETVRQFAAEQSASDEQEQRQVQREHSRYYLHLLSAQEEPLQSPQQRTVLGLIRADFANISAAWHRAVDQYEFTMLAPAIHVLFLFCETSGGFRIGMTLFTQASTQLQAAMSSRTTDQPTLQPLWGQVIVRLGICEVMLGDFIRGEQHLLDGLLSVGVDQERALALVYLGWAADERGELTEANERYRASLVISQRCNDLVCMATVLRQLSTNKSSDHLEACRFASESLKLWCQVGRPDRIANLLGSLAWYFFCLGDYATATAYWRESLTLCEQLDLLNEKAWTLDCMGFVAWCQGEMATAEQYLGEALVIYTELGRQGMIGMCKSELSLVLASVGRVNQAIALAQEAVALTQKLNNQMMLTMSLNYLGAVLIVARDFVEARRALREGVERAWQHQFFYNLLNAFYYFAELLVREVNATDRQLATDHKQFALELLSCVRSQPATWQIYRDKAAQLQAEIEGSLPDDVRTTTIARGQSCTLEEMINNLVGVMDIG
jgi:tetratricopeptide (TPR) repeat protein